jgi:2-dehydropantoate 2-reductase
MRTLVVGAGAIGGYFGGRLREANRDVTFLVRPRRASELAAAGLRIRSPLGDAMLSAPPAVLAENLQEAFDLVLLSVKAYDLQEAMTSFAPAVGPETAILPLLNGMRHLETLGERFGPSHVLGGQCVIAATLNDKHEVVHLNEAAALSFGERDGTMSERVKAIGNLMAGARFESRASATILLDMWEKWVFLATLAGGTCLMRGAIGDIAAAPGGADLVLRLLDECRAIAAAQGYAPRDTFLDRIRPMLTAVGSDFTASMLRDIENGAPIEADHIIGNLLQRGPSHLLPIVYTHLKTYEARRARHT